MTWTYNEISLLRDNYGTLPVVAIAKLIGKSEDSIRWKASKLRLRSKLPHAIKIPLGSVATLRAHNMSARKIGRLLGYSHKGVRYAEQNHTFAKGAQAHEFSI